MTHDHEPSSAIIPVLPEESVHTTWLTTGQKHVVIKKGGTTTNSIYENTDGTKKADGDYGLAYWVNDQRRSQRIRSGR